MYACNVCVVLHYYYYYTWYHDCIWEYCVRVFQLSLACTCCCHVTRTVREDSTCVSVVWPVHVAAICSRVLCTCVSVVFGSFLPCNQDCSQVLCVGVFQLSLACTTATGPSWPCSRLYAGLVSFLSQPFSLATVSSAALLQNGEVKTRVCIHCWPNLRN